MKNAIETNPYTNPDGKAIVHTIAADKIKDTPRKLGGVERKKDY